MTCRLSMWKVNPALVNISIETCILIKPNKFKKNKTKKVASCLSV